MPNAPCSSFRRRIGPGSRAWPARGSVLAPDANPGPGSSGPGPGSPIRTAWRQWIYISGQVPNPQVADLVALVHAAVPRLPMPSPVAIGAGPHVVRPGDSGACRGLAASWRRHDTSSVDDTRRFVPDRRDAPSNIVTAWVDGTRLLAHSRVPRADAAGHVISARRRMVHPVLQGDLRSAASCSPSAGEVMRFRRKQVWGGSAPPVSGRRSRRRGSARTAGAGGWPCCYRTGENGGRGLAVLIAKPLGAVD